MSSQNVTLKVNSEKLTEYLQTGLNKFINLEAFRLVDRAMGVV